MIVQQAVHLAISGAGIVVATMFVLWLIHLAIRNAAVVDVGWALCLALVAIYYAFAGPGYTARKFAMAAMVGFWGFRLAGYLLFARVIGHPEEGRYVQLRKEWKRHLGLRFLFFFEFQALLDVVLSAPFLLASLNVNAPLGFLEKFGAGIWLVGMIGKRSPTCSFTSSNRTPRIPVRRAAPACGSIRAIRIIFSSGSSGSAMRS